MTGAIETVTPAEHFDYIVRKYIHGIRFYAPPALLGVIVALRFGGLTTPQKQLVYLLAMLTFTYSIYTALGGKFWLYHWMPFRFLATACTALMLVPLVNRPQQKLAETGLALLFLAILTVWVSLYGFTKQSLRFPVMFCASDQGIGTTTPQRRQG